MKSAPDSASVPQSPIPWLPEVPEGWETHKIRQNFRIRTEKVSEKDFPPLSVAKIGIVPQLADVAISMAEGDTRKLVRKGDYVVNSRSDRKGSCGIAPQDGSVTTISIVLEPYGIERGYVNYLFRSTPWVEEFYRNGRGIVADLWTTRYQEMRNMMFPLPPLPEQRAIVAFLDEKCAKIDQLIAAKKREVELLRELKQAIIAEEVTGAALERNRPTGVFWQPSMPDGWRVRKLRHVLKKLDRARTEGAELLVCTNKGKVVKRGDAKIGLVSEDESIYQGVAKGDLLIHGMDTWHGAIAVSDLDGMCTPVVHVCDSSEDKHFIAYCLQNMARGRLFKLISNGVRQNTSDFRSWEKVAPLPIVLPPLDEQRAIVARIGERSAKIDAAAAKLESEAEALKEWRERLIADAVTGKRRIAWK